MPEIVVVQWARLGDILQTRVLLDRLRSLHPGTEIVLCADAGFASVVRRLREVDRFWPVDLSRFSTLSRHRDSQAALLHELAKVLAEAPLGPVDEVYVLTRSTAAVLFAELLHPRAIKGYHRAGSNLEIPPSLERLEKRIAAGEGVPVHIADLWAGLAEGPLQPHWPSPMTGARRCGQRERLGIICDAGEPYRAIPIGWLADLISATLGEGDVQISLFAGSRPSRNDGLSQFSGTNRVSDRRGETSLDDLCDELANCDVVIGPDTGSLHLAAALGTRVIGLYHGGARGENTGPYADEALVIQDPAWTRETMEVVTNLVHDSEGRGCEGLSSPVTIMRSRLDEYGLVYEAGDLSDSHREAQHAERKSWFIDASSSADSLAIELSVIIPECGGEYYTDALLMDLDRELAGRQAEIILVRSCAGSDSVERTLRSVPMTVAQKKERLSFARACNWGAQLARGRRLLFLNNDTRLPESCIAELLESGDESFVVSPVIRYVDGLIQNAGVHFERGEVMEIGHGLPEVESSFESPRAVSGVAMLVSREVFVSLNGFDENYVNGYEDLDFCLRAEDKGIESVVLRQTSVIHFRGSTPGRFEQDESNLRLFLKHWGSRLQAEKPRHLPKRSVRPAPLVIISEEPSGAAGSAMRWIWPLKRLGLREGSDFVWITAGRLEEGPQELLAVCGDASTVIVFRPLQTPGVQQALLSMVEDRGIRLIVDCDDLVIGRFAKSSLRAVSRSQYEADFRQLLEHATLITVSTQNLAAEMERLNYQAKCLETIADRRQLAAARHPRDDDEIRIGFMGTPSHLLDLGAILPALSHVLDADERIRFYWWGCRPGELAYHPQVRQGGPFVGDYESHLRRLHAFGLDMAVVPLSDTPSSRVKSPVKYFEYALAGIPAVYSNVSPYSLCVRNQQTGILSDDSTPSWVTALRDLIENPQQRACVAKQARADVVNRMEDPDGLAGHRDLLQGVLRETPTCVEVE